MNNRILVLNIEFCRALGSAAQVHLPLRRRRRRWCRIASNRVGHQGKSARRRDRPWVSWPPLPPPPGEPRPPAVRLRSARSISGDPPSVRPVLGECACARAERPFKTPKPCAGRRRRMILRANCNHPLSLLSLSTPPEFIARTKMFSPRSSLSLPLSPISLFSTQKPSERGGCCSCRRCRRLGFFWGEKSRKFIGWLNFSLR